MIFGDGSLGYSIAEIDTFVRHKLPILSVVGNDACWTQIAREQKPTLGSDVACNLDYTNYQVAAEGLGGKGFLLDAKDKENLIESFRNARLLTRQGQPVLVNVLMGKSKFREGSVSV